MFDFFTKRRRAKLREQPFSEEWRAILARNVPMATKLDEAERRQLEGLVQIFLAEKSFEGCGGLEMNDEVRVTVAGQACILLLHMHQADDGDLYPNLDVILVYPSAFQAKTRRVEGGVVLEGDEARLGESWQRGVVVLAWDSVRRGAANIYDGHNVVLHEFAHQLDSEDGGMDGAPELGTRSRYSAWAQVLGHEFDDLTRKLHEGRKADIDAYGAQSPPEFFAVVTEMFFEKPTQLKKKHPELYQQLVDFYRQDPARR